MITLAILASAALNCADPMSQSEMTQCAAQDFARQDAALNAQWRVTLAKMQGYDRGIDRSYDKRPTYSASLITAQRAWIAFRDSHCALDGMKFRGGSGEPMLVYACKVDLTKERIKQLRELAEGFE
jgi:uncharacterized protein YecT (DUF1311 family)